MNKNIYPHLSEKELTALENWCKKNKINQTSKEINWQSILEPSKDADPLRATAIDGARILTAQRYAKQGGPKISRGSNAKKPKTILPEKRVKAIRELHRKK